MNWKDFLHYPYRMFGFAEKQEHKPDVKHYVRYLFDNDNNWRNYARKANFESKKRDQVDLEGIKTSISQNGFTIVPGDRYSYLGDGRIMAQISPSNTVSRTPIHHEIGHGMDGWSNFILDEKYPHARDDETDPMYNVGSVHSITNGPHYTDRLKREDRAWELAPKPIDETLKRLALESYREEAASRWRYNALETIAGDSDLSSSFEEASKMKIPVHQVEREYPQIIDFWRTNTLQNAIKYLKSIKK